MPVAQDPSASRGRLFLSLTVICLLAIIAIGLYVRPRFDYETIATRQLENAQRLNRIEDSLSGSMRRRSPSRIDELSEEHDHVLTALAEQARRLDAMEERIGDLQELTDPGVEVLHTERDQGPVERLRAELRALNVSTKVEEAASRFPAMMIKQWGHHRLIDELIRAGVIPVAEADALPAEQRKAIESAFHSFIISMDLIRSQQKLAIEELIRAVDANGENRRDYLDLPLGLSFEEASALQREAGELLGPGEYSTSRKKPDLGVKRLYRFSYDRHQRLREFPWLRDQSRLRLFSQIDQIVSDE